VNIHAQTQTTDTKWGDVHGITGVIRNKAFKQTHRFMKILSRPKFLSKADINLRREREREMGQEGTAVGARARARGEGE
jgi:hypothetical protein